MKAEYVKIYKSVHTWTGIVSGMALFIAFYAGALTVFKEPLARWAAPALEVRSVPIADTPELIAKTLAAHPAAGKGFVIHLHASEDIPARMTWKVRDEKADDHDETATRNYVATLDAGGAAQVQEASPSPLASFIDVLHRVVGLPFDNDPSRWFMGVVSVLYSIALFSGVVALLPSLVKDFFALRAGRNLKRMWLDAHNVVGIASLPFHIVMALSAVVFAFHDQIYIVQDKMLHEGKWSQRPSNKAPPPPSRDPQGMLSPLQLVQTARALSPGFEPSNLQYVGVTTPRAVVRIWGKNSAAVLPRAVGGFVAIDPYTGKVVSREYLPGGQDTPNLWISSFFALHMAAFGNAAVQWLYFILGMAGAWLFYSGNLLWVETRRKRATKANSSPVQRLDTRLMAAATVGVCLGSVCGISLMMVGSRWLHGWAGDLLAWHQILYYTTFFAAIGWSFLRGAPRAAVHLLWCAAALTIAIPTSSLLAAFIPALGLTPHHSPAALGVDVTAFVGAACFVWMAIVTSRRIRAALPDTVWWVPPREEDKLVLFRSTKNQPSAQEQ